MKKSILDQFASDAINAPAAVTGGGGEKNHKSTHKSNRGQSKKSDRKSDRSKN
jgi:hypothetical protein